MATVAALDALAFLNVSSRICFASQPTRSGGLVLDFGGDTRLTISSSGQSCVFFRHPVLGVDSQAFHVQDGMVNRLLSLL